MERYSTDILEEAIDYAEKNNQNIHVHICFYDKVFREMHENPVIGDNTLSFGPKIIVTKHVPETGYYVFNDEQQKLIIIQ